MPAAVLQSLVRDVPDYPKPGIMFKDITPVLAEARAFSEAVDLLVAPHQGSKIDVVLGIEARGFIFGAGVAIALGVGFVPVRKPGKLPGRTLSQGYRLEYGSDRLEVHVDAVPAGARERLQAAFDIDLTQPEWALGYRFDIVLRGRAATPMEEPHDD